MLDGYFESFETQYYNEVSQPLVDMTNPNELQSIQWSNPVGEELDTLSFDNEIFGTAPTDQAAQAPQPDVSDVSSSGASDVSTSGVSDENSEPLIAFCGPSDDQPEPLIAYCGPSDFVPTFEDMGPVQQIDQSPWAESELMPLGAQPIAEIPYEFRDDNSLNQAMSNLRVSSYSDPVIEQLQTTDPTLANALQLAHSMVETGGMSQSGFAQFQQNIVDNLASGNFNNAHSLLAAASDLPSDKDMMAAFKVSESTLSSNGDHRLWDEGLSNEPLQEFTPTATYSADTPLDFFTPTATYELDFFTPTATYSPDTPLDFFTPTVNLSDWGWDDNYYSPPPPDWGWEDDPDYMEG